MLYICLFLYFIFSIFIPENKSVTNGRFATYHKTKTGSFYRGILSRVRLLIAVKVCQKIKRTVI